MEHPDKLTRARAQLPLKSKMNQAIMLPATQPSMSIFSLAVPRSSVGWMHTGLQLSFLPLCQCLLADNISLLSPFTALSLPVLQSCYSVCFCRETDPAEAFSLRVPSIPYSMRKNLGGLLSV